MSERKLSPCARCARPYDGDPRWNVVYVQGRAVQALCPDCQTPEEAAEAEENRHTYDYSHGRSRSPRPAARRLSNIRSRGWRPGS